MQTIVRQFSLDSRAVCVLDQVTVVSGMTKSEFVADAILVGALILRTIGEEALRGAADAVRRGGDLSDFAPRVFK